LLDALLQFFSPDNYLAQLQESLYCFTYNAIYKAVLTNESANFTKNLRFCYFSLLSINKTFLLHNYFKNYFVFKFCLNTFDLFIFSLHSETDMNNKFLIF